MDNTHALIRYRALDACLRDRTRRYYFQDLLDVVNKVLDEFDGSSIKERQLYTDLEHMDRKALAGDVEVVDVIEKNRGLDGKVYYRYTDPNYSMFDSYLTQEEEDTLKNTIKLLRQFKGLPQFDWLEEAVVRLKQQFQLDGTERGTVIFSQNPDLEGMKWYERLFNATVKMEVLELTYHRFGRPIRKRVVHPYQLRQYNDRWYLVCYEERQAKRFPFVVLPIDRILDVQAAEGVKFREKDPGLDFDDYFYHIVGVSLNPESEPQRVMLKATYPAVWYIETKPLHRSQKIMVEAKEYKVFELEIIPNEEFVQQLLVYADQVEVLEPKSIRENLRDRGEKIADRNKKVAMT